MTQTMQDDRMRRGFRIALGFYVLVLILGVTPFTMDPAGDVKRLLLGLFSVGIALVWLGVTWAGRLPVRRPGILLEVLLGFLALYLVSTFFSAYPGVSITELAYFFQLFLLYLVASQVYSAPAHGRGLMGFLLTGLTAAALYAFAQKFGWDPFPWGGRHEDIYTNLPSTFGNPNLAAHTIALALPCAVYVALRPARVWVLAPAVLMAAWFYLTDQRGGWLGLAAGVVLLLAGLVLGRVTRRPAARVALSLLLAGLLGLGGASAWMAKNQLSHGLALPLDGSLLLRYNGYLSAAGIVTDAPLLGHGPGVYKIITPAYWTDFEQSWFAQELRANAHVHNDLLEIAADAGLPAAGLFLAAMTLAMGFALLLGFTGGVDHPGRVPENGDSPRGPPSDKTQRRRLGYTLAVVFATFLVDGLFGFNLRAPVSASVLFLAFGLLEGVWGPVRPQAATSAPRLGWRVAAGACCLFFLFWNVRVFASEVWMQTGMRHHQAIFNVLDEGPGVLPDLDKETASAVLEGHAKEAVAAFEQGQFLVPWNHHFAGRIGEIYMAMREVDKAKNAFRQSLEKNPYYIPSLTRLGHALIAGIADPGGRGGGSARDAEISAASLQEAEEQALCIQRLCPPFHRGEDLLGRIALARARHVEQRGRDEDSARIADYWREAEAHFVRAIERGAPNHIELYRLLYEVRKRLERPSAATDALLRAAQAKPTEEVLWQPFFELVRETPDSAQLRGTLFRMLAAMEAMNPPPHKDIARGFLALAHDFAEAGDTQQAEGAYRDAIDHGGDMPEVWAEFGRYAQEHERIEAYVSALEDTVEVAQAAGYTQQAALAVGQLVLAEIETARQDVNAALDAYEKAVQFGPRRPDVWTNFAAFAREHGRMPAFQEILTASVEKLIESGPAPLLYVRAVHNLYQHGPAVLDEASRMLYQQHRRYPKGSRLARTHLSWALHIMLEYVKQASEEGVELCNAYLNFGIMLNDFKQYALAERLLPRAHDCAEGTAAVHAGIHWSQTMLATGRSGEALNLLKDLRRRFPEDPDLHLVYAQTLAKAGKAEEALAEYNSVLQTSQLTGAVRERIEEERNALL
ncbi:MAG: tetratricopeptide repeat protein [Candidatus Hydrogenedentota bacterium]